MNFGLAGILVVISAVVWLFALIDALRRPADAWDRAGQSQIVWILVIVLVNVLGAIIYLIVARPQLESTG